MLAVVTCHYNQFGFVNPRRNLHRFLRQMERDGVMVYGAECYKPGRKPETRNYSGWKQFEMKPQNELWQKEALLNIAASRLPKEVTNIAWVDADVWFDNPNWVADTEKALEEFEVVQMFEHAIWTDMGGWMIKKMPSSGAVVLNERWGSHPGFAWAMRRDVWDNGGGLYPFCVSGGADTMMALTFTDQPFFSWVNKHAGINPEPFNAWAEKYRGLVRCGVVKGGCWHEWHGDLKDRGYADKHKICAMFDQARHLTIDEYGLAAWTKQAPVAAIQGINRIIRGRREDGRGEI
jgi:hypothetical protein